MPKLGREPTLIIQAVVAALVAIQVAVLDLPTWAHTVIGVAIIGLGALVNRSQVTPVSAPAPAPGPQPVRPSPMVGETSEPQVDEQPELVVNAPGDTWPTVNTAYDPEAGLEPTPEEKAPEA